ncbi:protein kinase domain-containing protein [Microcoleus anatoxicus]|uniref:non-specific serine/threonine protein kinase n=1 Tax=Microcoleus anatoxicus PTRS2 TaxID=2705321 RepID=A0ABU8YRN3_9CYAN
MKKFSKICDRPSTHPIEIASNPNTERPNGDPDIFQKALELFRQEAIRLDELGNHPQIPNLLACFEQETQIYLVQEFIEGLTLKQELDQNIYSENQIWQLLQDLLPVLQFIHEHRVIHRDIKPENIIRRQSDNKPVLIDFGIAKLQSRSVWIQCPKASLRKC